MEKRYLCFTCYAYHPEMRGVSKEEFVAGKNTCQEEKCACYKQQLEAATYCDTCEAMFPSEKHTHS